MLLNAFKDIGLAVNTGKTKYMAIGRHRGMTANAHVKIGNNSYEKVKTFNPPVTQSDLNEINGADGRVFKFLEVKLHLFLLIP